MNDYYVTIFMTDAKAGDDPNTNGKLLVDELCRGTFRYPVDINWERGSFSLDGTAHTGWATTVRVSSPVQLGAPFMLCGDLHAS